MSEQMPHMARPCPVCPWRKDSPPGGFPTCNYVQLRETSVGPDGGDVPLGTPMFGCHCGTDEAGFACAGWLAVVGTNHIGVRYALLTGRLDPEALTPGEDWPQLYDSYDDMAEAVGAPDGQSRWELAQGREGKTVGAGRALRRRNA